MGFIMKRLLESAKLAEATDGSYPVVLISPGQGTSGYYHEEVIRDFAGGAFPKGTHVYLDHLKEGETRSPSKLLGYLTEETVVDESGQATNRFKPLSKHKEWIEEVRPFVGLSVSVAGEGRKGEVDGRQTLIVESLTPSVTNTVDLVSYAGRGGRFLEHLLEEALEDVDTQSGSPAGSEKGNEPMAISEERFDALVESVAGLVAKIDARESAEADAAAAAQAGAPERSEVIAAVRAVESADISDELRTRLMEGIEKDGNLDVAPAIEQETKLRESLTESLTEQIKTQLEEEAGSSAGGSASNDYEVKGW